MRIAALVHMWQSAEHRFVKPTAITMVQNRPAVLMNATDGGIGYARVCTHDQIMASFEL